MVLYDMMLFLFIGGVIALGYITIKLKRRNREMFRRAFEELRQEAEAYDSRKDYDNDYRDIE